ncbi:Nonribosomal peptide synthetase gra1 [Fusarium sp. DS 682]|nr:Nonribosomal peptide synthetase gra1 [Fusarium sp. DS 682]
MALVNGNSIVVRVENGSDKLPDKHTKHESVCSLTHRKLKQYTKNNKQAIPSVWHQYLKDIDHATVSLFDSVVPTVPATEAKLTTHRIHLLGETPLVSNPSAICAAFAVVMGEYSCSQDVLFGMRTGGRIVPLRVLWDKKDKVGSFLDQVDTKMDMIQSFPSGIPFPSIRNVLAFAEEKPLLSGKVLSLEENEAMSMEICFRSGYIEIGVLYNRACVGLCGLQRFLKQLETVFHQLCNKPTEYDIENVKSITQDDLRDLVSWNSGRTASYATNCIHDLIKQHVLSSPSAPAISGWDGDLSYAQLDKQSSLLANYLYRQGVRPHDMVPLVFQKSVWFTISVLSVLKLGAAIVPLDPAWPRGRQMHIIKDIGSSRIITNVPGSGTDYAGLKVINVSQLSVANETATTTSYSVTTRHAAYAYYTSGTTGQPKGCVIEHGAFVPSALERAKVFGRNRDSRVLQVAAYTFDPTMEDILTTLMMGGCICVPSQADCLNDLAGAVGKYNANTLNIAPSLVRSLQPSQVPSLKTLLLGGEMMNISILRTWAEEVSLFNSYGPTECCIKSSTNLIRNADEDPRNIGRPIGCSIWLVRPGDIDTLAAVGSIGEMLIHGPNLARCYLNRPDLTSRAFPCRLSWASQVGLSADARFYRTGDLARLNADGSICILGRIDDQVKIHGQRVELGEIDHQLNQCLPVGMEAISGVVNFLDRDVPTLVAFIQNTTPKSTNADDSSPMSLVKNWDPTNTLRSDIMEQLRHVLPSYMVPSVFLPVQRFLYTSHGKTNRRGMCKRASELRLQDVVKNCANSGQETPMLLSGSTEATVIRQLWSMALGFDENKIDLHDEFAALGGDSLAAIRLGALFHAHDVELSVEDISPQSTIFIQAEKSKKENHVPKPDAVAILPTVKRFGLLGQDVDVDDLCKQASGLCQVNRDAIDDIYAASPLQESLMALAMEDSPYISQFVFRIPSTVDMYKFRKAWKRVASELPILRTRIIHIHGQGSLQVVVDEDIEWTETKQVTLSQFLEHDKQKPMHLGDRLVRFAVIQDTSDSSFLVWTCHHACHDGRTAGQILRLVEATYLDRPISPPAPYRLYIQFQQDLCHKDWQAHWKKTLDGAPIPIFPAQDSPLHRPVTDASYHHSFALPRPIDTSTTFTFSPTSIIQAAWALIVSRYEGSNDVTFGTIVGGNATLMTGVDAIVGPTNNTIPVRVMASENWTVEMFLSHVKKQFEPNSFQHIGLAKLRDISPEMADVVNVRSLLVIQQPSSHNANAMGLERVPISEYEGFKYPLIVECFLESADHLSVNFICDSHILDQGQISRLVVQLENTIHLLSNNQTALLNEIDIICPGDMAQILKWQANLPLPSSLSLDQRVFNQAETRPDAIAICSWDGQLTYRELRNLTSRLAVYLQGAGVRQGQRVLYQIEKSASAVVTKLAILTLGATCVPLGGNWPRARSEAVAADTEASLLLVSPTLSGALAGLVPDILEVSMSLIQNLPGLENDITSFAKPADVAFILFTSGSTGTPKGVQLPHCGLVTNLTSVAQHMNYGPRTRLYQFSDFSFDLSIYDIFGVLMSGGCLCMPSEQERTEDLVGSMNRMKINTVALTPSIAKMIEPSSVVPTLRFLSTGGEALDATTLASLARQVGMVNGYGVTECSVWSTCTDLLSLESDPRNIGRGINCLTWIVDPQHPDRLMPIGMVGELILQGPGVALNYLNKPDESSRVFLDTLPWSGDKGRAYKSGDLVKYAADGSLIYVQRKDAQLKVRGQRFEAGEVEFHLQQCGLPDKIFCVDVVQAVSADRKEAVLVVFLCCTNDRLELKDASDLKVISLEEQHKSIVGKMAQAMKNLLPRLPSYMIPQAIIPVNQMPFSPAGKLDKRALRSLVTGMSPGELRQLFHPPQKEIADRTASLETELEREMGLLWAQVLPTDESHVFNADDDFFQLGGHSITLMHLISVGKDHGISINFRDAFLHSTLGAMSRQVAARNQEETTMNHMIPSFTMAPTDADHLIQEVASICNIHSDEIVDLYPCTPFQEATMTLSLSRPGLYMAQFVWSLPHKINLERFKQAWETMAKFSPMIRTRLIYSSRYWQVVTSTEVPWTVTETDMDLNSYLKLDKASPMGLGEPLNRLALIRDNTSATKYFAWTCHHSTYDGHSFALVQDWLGELYIEGGGKPPLVPFNVFVNHTLNDSLSEASESFWKETMDDARMPSFPKLPLGAHLQSANSILKEHISLPARDRLDVTIASAVQAAWSILLAQYENSDDVLFGMTLSGRNAAVEGIENIAGPTICTVPLRVRIDWQDDISSWLRGVQQCYVDAATFGQIGMNNISQLSTDAEMVRHIRSLLIVQAPSSDTVSGLEKIGCRRVESNSNNDFVSYAIVIECTPNMAGEKMEIKISYDAKVLEEQSVRRLARQMEHILQQLFTDSCRKIGDICLTSPSDIETLSAWNKSLPQPVEATVHGLFAEMLTQQQHVTAICSWDGEMTYAELDSHSSHLAEHLVALGVGSGHYVPLCFEKSIWMVVSMLAVMKAGGACVCLDPNHPPHHHEVILGRVSARIIIASPIHENKFSGHNVVPVSAASMERIASHQPSTLPSVGPDQIAFVVFTSGTTSEPKGIMLEHRALCTSINAHGRFMKFGPGSRVLQFASYTFDVSIAEIFTTLLFGGCICIPSDHARMNNLSGTIQELGVNQAYLTASVAALLDPNDVDSLQVLSVGGEQVGQEVLETWGNRVELLNMYGPAETTIWCSGKHSVKPHDHAANIGHGLGVRMWLTDVNDEHKLAPIGAVGEIVLEGPLLARGYLNGNNAVFVESPSWAKAFQTVKGFDAITGRVYRSGDLGKYQPDGSIAIHGRRDTQIKIRGQRVEVSQIEDQLQRLAPGFRCVVDVSGAETPVLVAFIGLEIPLDHQETTENPKLIVSGECMAGNVHDIISGLESQLANTLPPYSVPAHYLALKRIPLSTSGKTDRKKLRRIAYDFLKQQNSTEPSPIGPIQQQKKIPTTEMEWNMFGLWAQVLGVHNLASLGTDDNFFRCGGDSIKAMRLVSLASQRGIDLQVADVFKYPVMGHLAQALVLERSQTIQATPLVQESPAPFSLLTEQTQEQIKAQAAMDCDISPDLIQDIYPCTPLQEGLVALSQKQPGVYVAQFKFRISDGLNIRRLRQAWETVCDQAPVLRSRLVSTASGLVQAVLTEDFWWHERLDIDASLELQKDKTAVGGFGCPLQRFRIFRDTNTGQMDLAWTIHHAAYDGWSIQRILERVALLYQDQPIPEEDTCVPFSAFAKHVSGIIGSDESRKFWQSYLRNVTPPTFMALPSPTYQAVANSIIESEVSDLRFPKSFTLTTVLRAAWALVVGAYQRSDDVVFLTTVFGRNASLAGIEKIIGPTISTIPFLVELKDQSMTVGALLNAIQDAATETMAYEQLGLQSIRNISADCEAACMAQNLLVVQNSREKDGNVVFDGFEKLPDESKGFSTVPFTLECRANPEGRLIIEATYDSKVVDPAQANRIVKTFEHISQQMCLTHLKLSDIDLISPSDHDDIQTWNSTMPAATDDCIHHRLGQLAELHPDAEAICAWDGNFTFQELDLLSSRYAAYLQYRGVQAGTFVAICFNKCKWAVVAMLAIIKAGAASVPIDPKHPVGRRDGILSAVAASVVVTTSLHAQLFDTNAADGVETLVLDEKTMSQAPESLCLAESQTLPSDAVFVVFTSGSTGTPKAVVLQHRGICTGAFNVGDLIHLGPATRFFQFAAYTFDQSFGDIFHTLLRSGCVCIPSESDRLNDLAGSIVRLKANTAILTPTVACSIDPCEVAPHKIDVLALGGEPITAEAIQTWAPHTQLFNTYGPAECTLTSIGRPIGMETIAQPGNIGRGLGALIWLTLPEDPQRLAPIGTVGEILIEGPLLSRGYLNDGESTRAAFITDPAWSQSFPVTGDNASRRFYRTGDLGQYQRDGTIVCLGRRDSQVKLRGQRMELGEVEHHISTYTQSTVEVVADVFAPAGGASMLVACIGLGGQERENEECRLEADEQMVAKYKSILSGLHDHLSRMLPFYMLPTLYIPVNHIPRTSSAKKDRKTLHAMLKSLTVDQLQVLESIRRKAPSTRPLTEREKQLKQLWANSLKLDSESANANISIDSNFFHVGGDSVRAMTLVAAARKEGIHLTVADVFSHPALCDMAANAKSWSQTDEPAELAPYSLLPSHATTAANDLLREVCETCRVGQSQIQDIYPATPLQQALVALSIKDPGAYISTFIFQLPANLDLDLFRSSWEHVYDASHTLRTRIIDTATTGMLQVVVSGNVLWGHGDTLAAYCDKKQKTEFNFGQGMAIPSIVKEKEGKTFFVLTLHHAIYDGWSLQRLLAATEQVYRGQSIPRLVPFNHFVHHTAQTETETDVTSEFWRSYLKDAPISSFPQQSTPLKPTADHIVSHTITSGSNLAARSGITVTSLMRTAWALILAIYQGEVVSDVVFGTVVGGRSLDLADIDCIDGPTIATIPFRVSFDPEESVDTLMQHVQDTSIQTMQHEQFGMQNIMKVSGDASSACQFQTLLIVQNTTEHRAGSSFLDLGKVYQRPDRPPSIPLVVECIPSATDIRLEIHFDSKLLGEPQANRLITQLAHVTKQLINSDPAQTVSSIDMMSAADIKEIKEWNVTPPPAMNGCLQDMILQHAQQCPNSIAIDSWDATLTYGQLDHLSSLLAQYLNNHGVKPETKVPFCMEKSAFAIVSMVAILRSGGCFVPLGMSSPRKRREDIIKRVQARIILVSPNTRSLFKDMDGEFVEVTRSMIEDLPRPSKLICGPSPSHAAYVLFTSGSTGTPKGVVIEHHAILTSVSSFASFLGFRATTRVLQFAPYVFDVSIGEIFATLFSGGCLCIASESRLMDNLPLCIRELDVNLCVLTPTFADTITPSAVPSLQTLVLGGEPMRKKDVETWASAVRLVNGYGPTEASVLSMAYHVPGVQSPCNLIGLPVGCRAWIVRPNKRNILILIGAVGELVLEGNTLARGYLDQDPTEESFVVSPTFLGPLVHDATASRVYKTGDLVRYNDHGVIEFVSRKDTQVKFHGRRIELRDIEHNAMGVMPEAKHLAVELVQPGDKANQSLALFFHTGIKDSAVDDQLNLPMEQDLRARLYDIKCTLSETLPPYMVPSLYVPLSYWPNTSNGKLDRHRLQTLVANLTAEMVATYSLYTYESSGVSSDQEKQLAQLWGATLHVDAHIIGANDSFFQHGGDSIAAVRLVTLARQQGIGLSVETLLSNPVLRDMARSMSSAQVFTEAVVRPFSQVADHQQEILQASAQCGVEPAMVDDIYPCSPLQNSLMAVSLKSASAYLSQFVLAIPEGLGTEQLQSAWNTVILDLPILRTRFFQPSSSNMEHPMLQAVIGCEPEWREGNELHEFLRRDKETPMKLGSPLTRFTTVVDKTNDERYFVLTAHHAVYDGWSIASTFDKVEKSLKGLPLPRSVGYNAFIQYLHSLNSEDSEAFWSSTLDGAPPTIFPELPSHNYEPATNDSLHHQFDYPSDSLPRQSGLTMATVLRGAWGLLVSKYCDSPDVVFGVTVNGRMAAMPGIEMVQGPTIATIPFRARYKTDQGVTSYLEELHEQQIQSIPHEHYGLQNIKHHLSGPIARMCEFQNLLVIQSSRESSLHDSSYTMGSFKSADQEYSASRGFHNLALVVECTVHPTAIHIDMSFDSCVIAKTQVGRIARHFQHLIVQMQAGLANADFKVNQIDHVSPSDLAEILEWNNSIPDSVLSCVHELFEQRVRLQPSAPAICARDGQLTYSELEIKAGTLASYLKLQGLGPGVLVPLLFEKSCWAIVAMMAVLKAGAANVALNPEHPQARLEGLIKTTQGDVILCSRKYFQLASGFEGQVIVVDEDLFNHLDLISPSLATAPCTTRCAGPDDPSFVLFTSGTTGKPKGIVINHAAFCSSINGHSSTLRFSTGPGSRNFQFTAYTSDVSIGEIFTSLAVGSCVCVPSDYDRMNNLAGSMRDLGVTWAFLTPSVAALLSPEEVPALKTLLFGGETATPENISTWADALYLINSAGPAECSIWTHCNPGISTADIGSNWGYNLGCATWITNPDNPSQLAPIGVVGEMLIDGPNLAQGYLNDPERTQRAFVEIQLAGKQRRLYRTGDLARLMADGKTQFLGRRDTQVKLRGQRVEIGEVENQIRRHIPDSTLVAVEMVRIAQGKSAPLLAAFLAQKDGPVTDRNGEVIEVRVRPATETEGLDKILGQLAVRLAKILPQHMIPSAFVPLTSMPLTASAKTDRNALAALASTISVEQLSYYALSSAEKQLPSTQAEQQMAQLWQQVLKIDIDISVHDSFFRIGGDSISAMQLVSRARSASISLTVEQIFKNPTLQHMTAIATVLAQPVHADMAKPFSLIPQTTNVNVDIVRREAQEQCQVTIEQVQDIYPCSALQEGLLALSLKTSGSYVAQMPFQIPDELNLQRFKDAWAAMVARNAPILRTRFFESPSQGHLLMQAVIDAPIEWQYGDNLDEYIATDAACVVQLGMPTSRYAIVSDARKGRFFVFTAHHAIYDGASLGPIFDSVKRTYYQENVEPTPPYSLFIRHLLGMDSESSRAYWEKSLDGASPPTFPRLPSMDYRPATNSAFKHTMGLPARHDTEFTVSSIVRAAWSLVVAAHSDTDDIIFASTLGGRTLPIPGIENIIGPTLATVPVRVTVDRSVSVSDFLTMIQEQSTSMLPHEQYGMQNIRRISNSISAVCELHSLLIINTSFGQGLETDALGLRQVDLGRLDGFHNFALSIECTVEADSLSLSVNFDNHVIDGRQLRRLVGQLEHTLKQLSTCIIHTKLSDIDLMSPADMEEINSWNAFVPPPQQTCVHTLVEQRVQSQPHTPAVCSWEGELTYQQLDELSSALATHLINNFAVVPGTLIPILFEKSIWTVVTMLAVLKAGGANVPLDPEQPLPRLKELVADIGATMAISSSKYQEKARKMALRSMFVDRDILATLDSGSTCQRSAEISYNDPAFILFTSGSTGKPKAILIDHTAFTSSIRGHGDILRYRKGSRNLQFTAYTSDVSIGEIFTSLSAGACVCIPSDFERMNDLAGAMERMRVDWAFLTPSVASLLDANKVPTLKTLVFGGETATPENVAIWAPRLFLINSFGPAECSIWTHCDPGVSSTHNGSHIGYAIGCATWIVDPTDYNKLVPIGSVGELIVEGPNVAKGYLNNEAKTREAFLEIAAWMPKGRKNRLYKMGDLVRYLPDGKVQFLGRKDSQVKLHGQRIELGEIEHQVRVALAKQHVSHNVSVAIELVSLGTDSSQSSFLAVFMDYGGAVSDDGAVRISSGDEVQQWARQTFRAIRDHLVETLPRHMVPNVFLPLTRMPLNASAKTDRKVLQQIVSGMDVRQLALYSVTTGETSITKPTTTNEKTLHHIWADILSIPPDDFGTESNFMGLGGDSIAAMKMIPIAQASGLSISVEDLFSHPVLRDLARVAQDNAPDLLRDIVPFSLVDAGTEQAELLAEASLYCNLQPQDLEDIYPCTPVQEQFITATQTKPGAYTLQDVFKLPSDIDLVRFQSAWSMTVSSHAVLRTRIFYSPNQRQHLQAVGSVPKYLDWILSTNLKDYLISDKAESMRYGKPLVRSAIISEEQERYFVVTYHHSVYDALSLKIIMENLENFYQDDSYQVEEPKYNAFVHHLAQLKNQQLSLVFWQEHLAGNGAGITPLFHSTVGADYTPRVDSLLRHTISFPMHYQQSQLNLTLAAFTYAALSLVTARLTESSSAVLELTLLGRSVPVKGIERMVGTTVTSAPLRIDITTGNDKHANTPWAVKLEDYLHNVQHRSNSITSHEHTGMSTIRRLSPETEHITSAALPIVVHPSNPHKEGLGSKIGLQRREIQSMGQSSSAFYMDIAVSGGEGLDISLPFDSRIVDRGTVVRLVSLLDMAVMHIMRLSASGRLDTSVGDLNWDSPDLDLVIEDYTG